VLVCSALAGIVPVILWAHAAGPDARNTGAPGDSTCAQSGCHTGTAVNGGGGKVEIAFPNGQSYTPGQKIRLQVTITDSAARVYGFQASARLNSNLANAQAGTFTPADGTTQVICSNNNSRPSSGACPSGSPLEFIEHTAPKTSGTFTFDWTPPTTDQGNVTIYVAGNAANGNNQNTGDHIYTANYELTPAASSTAPSITSGKITEAFTYQTGVTPSSWIAIIGTNLASSTLTWDNADFSKGLPTTLGGVTVTMNGKSAPIFFVSSAQINVLAPTDLGAGPTQVTVTNSLGSGSANVTSNAQLCGFYAPFASNGNFYVTAISPGTGEYLGKSGLDPRVKRGARPGELISLYGTGFGDAISPPATTSFGWAPIALKVDPAISIGGTDVGSVSGFLVSPGLYQFNVTVPAGLADGDQPIIAGFGATKSSSAVLLTVQK
jgi:uncharacterized protein (TIGR03437 family)